MNEKDFRKIIEFLENKTLYIEDDVLWPWYKTAISELTEISELFFND